MPTLASLLDVVVAWANRRTDIVGVPLVGSWERGTAGSASDIDLILLTPDFDGFRKSRTWLDEIDWASLHVSVRSWRDAEYGALWSRNDRSHSLASTGPG